jgi:putative membrane protein
MQNLSLTSRQTTVWLIIFVGVLVWSMVAPKDGVTWLLEVFPALIAIGILARTFHSFPLTPIVYWLILAHSLILMVGGHYTYADVPVFEELGEWMGSRNNYDKLGHFAQGFVPVMVTRELLIRLKVVNGVRWTHFLSVCFCLAFSAFYELIEWVVALLSDEAADSFLGTQGYIWDTQSDMAWALFGAMTGLVLLHRWHNRQIQHIRHALSGAESA